MFYNVLFNSLYIFYKISKYKNAISVKINSFTLYYHYQNISLLIYNSRVIGQKVCVTNPNKLENL